MKNKKILMITLILPISLGVIMWHGELTILSNRNVNMIQSSEASEASSEDTDNMLKADIESEEKIDDVIEVKMEAEEAENLADKIERDQDIEITKEFNRKTDDLKVIELELELEKEDNASTQVTEEKVIQVKQPQGTSLNKYVLNIISTYPTGTSRYPYLLNNDYANYNGVTETLYYKGEIIAKAHPSGVKYSHCSGITFEVFFKAMQERNKALGVSPDNFNNMNKDQLFDFLLTWYAATGPKSQSNISVAVEKYGLGKSITNLEDAIKGDFIDISRTNNTGHTVVFLNWIKEGNAIVGIRYWSSQKSTNGIGYVEEYFNVKRSNGRVGNVMKDKVYIARVF